MPYPYSSYPVTGTQIRAAAEDTSGRLASVRTVAGQVERQHRGAVSAVEGDLASSVADAIDPMRQHASDIEKAAFYAAGCLEFFAHAVDIYNTDGVSPRSVQKLNRDWEAQVAANFGATREQLPADATQEQRAAENTRFSNAVSAARTARQHEFDAEFARLETNLDEAADDTQGKLNRGPNRADILDLYSAGALPVFAALIWSDIDFSRQYLPPEQAQELARLIAEQVEKGDVDADTVTLMSLYRSNADFAAEFYRHVTPEEMTAAITELSQQAFPYGSPVDPYQMKDERTLYRDFLIAAGTMLATYSKAVGDNAPPADFARTWGEAITSEDPEDRLNAAALSLLFKHGQDGGFDGDFLAGVTEIVYTYERERAGDGPIWGPRVGTDSGGGLYGPQDPFTVDGLLHGQYSYDPLANLLTAMDESPEAAEIFFGNAGTTEYGDTGAMVNDRLHYLLMERIWPTDDGDGLGQALEGATTHSRNDDASGARSAELASQLVHLIANEAGDDDGLLDDGWHIPEGMRDSVGNVAASYVADIFRIAQNESGDPVDLADWVYGDDDSETPFGDIYGLRGSNEDLATLLQEIGRGDDKSGITAVTAAALIHNNEITSSVLADYNAEHPDAPLTIDDLQRGGVLDDLGDQASRTGVALDFIVQNGLDGGKDQEADDEARQQVFSQAFSVATDLIPTPQGKIAGTLTSEGLSWLNEQISQVPESETEKWATDTDERIQRSLEYQTYNALLQNGYLDLAHDPAHGLPDGAVVYSNGEWQIDPRLYNGESDGVDPDVANRFNTWQDGREVDGHNGASPNRIFQAYLNALASRIAHH